MSDKPKELSVFTGDDFRHVAIKLRGLPKVEELASQVENWMRLKRDQFTLTNDQIISLVSVCPTTETLESMAALMQKHPDVPLAKPDKLLHRLAQVPLIATRLRFLKFARVEYPEVARAVPVRPLAIVFQCHTFFFFVS